MNPIVKKLRDAPAGKDDYVDYLNDALEGVEQLDEPEAVFAEAFAFLERFSGADLGMPGPLVHFLEQFHPAYIDQLCISMQRKPTIYGAWMLNRILNGSCDKTLRARLLSMLDNASKNSAADSNVREQALEFLQEQQE